MKWNRTALVLLTPFIILSVGAIQLAEVTGIESGSQAAVCLAAETLVEDGSNISKPDRADCTVCDGTGRVRTGDGISWTQCDACVAPDVGSPQPQEPRSPEIRIYTIRDCKPCRLAKAAFATDARLQRFDVKVIDGGPSWVSAYPTLHFEIGGQWHQISGWPGIRKFLATYDGQVKRSANLGGAVNEQLPQGLTSYSLDKQEIIRDIERRVDDRVRGDMALNKFVSITGRFVLDDLPVSGDGEAVVNLKEPLPKLEILGWFDATISRLRYKNVGGVTQIHIELDNAPDITVDLE